MSKIVKIALPCPLYSLLDYLAKPEQPAIEIGKRVIVPFRGRNVVGVVMGLTDRSDIPADKLKPIDEVFSSAPLPAELLNLLQWTADYYHYPIGKVIETALPVYLRRPKEIQVKTEKRWRLIATAQTNTIDWLKRAPKQAALLNLLEKDYNDQIFSADSLTGFTGVTTLLKKLEERQLIEQVTENSKVEPLQKSAWQALNAQQSEVVTTITTNLNTYKSYLLNGITGSGKTEVYLHFVAAVLKTQQQCLVMVPEIGLTPQTLSRFKSYFGDQVVALHSNLKDSERYKIWCEIANNEKQVLIGTRSAVFAPFKQLGGIVVDEEHDGSYKQQDTLRYHARDVAIYRAHQLDIPILLGSATPSLESLMNTQIGRYQSLQLTQRAGNAVPPTLQVVDSTHLRQQTLSATLIEAMHTRLQNKEQVLLFLNRRGYAPALLCTSCQTIAHCHRCDSHLTLHQSKQRLICHHCGYETRLIERCQSCQQTELIAVGAGTERLEEELQQQFPEKTILRIDRDTARNKGELEKHLTTAKQNQASILIGTQMLAKGHNFPNVTLVGIINIDHGLCSIDFRGPEHMAQLLVQVAGRAGRAEKKGHVIIQTAMPEHALLKQLIQNGYKAFSQQALEERQAQALPPFEYAALIRAEAIQLSGALNFLTQIKAQITDNNVNCLGPASAPMEKRGGRYRAQIWLQSPKRSNLHSVLRLLIHMTNSDANFKKAARKVRWSIDVDPMDIF